MGGAVGEPEPPVVEEPEVPTCTEPLVFTGVNDSLEAYTHESIMISWPSATGGCLNQGDSYVYEIYMSQMGGVQNMLVFTTSDNKFLMTGLARYTTYSFKVVASDGTSQAGTKVVQAETLFKPTPIFRGIRSVTPSRPTTGGLREQNLATLEWGNPLPAGISDDNPEVAYYKVYSAPVSGGQEFLDSCVNSCTSYEWSQIPPTCCTLGTESNPLSFAFTGLDPNQDIYSVIRACDSTDNCEMNKIEKTGKTGTAPSGMVLVPYPFELSAAQGGAQYALYVDITEAGCLNPVLHPDDGYTYCGAYNPVDRDGTELANPARPNLPVYKNVRQTEAKTACNRAAVTGMGPGATKRMMTYKEYLVASSWTKDDPFDFSTTGNVQYGLTEINHCNTGPAGALLPTGSDDTSICTSYKTSKDDTGGDGAQDLVGNAWEWVDDTIECTEREGDRTKGYCIGNRNDVDDAIFNFGYCSGTDADGCDSAAGVDPLLSDNFLIINEYTTEVTGAIFDGLLSTGYFFTGDSLSILPPVAGSFNGDHLESSYGTDTRYLNVGGSYRGNVDPSRSGRFNLRIHHAWVAKDPDLSFRCVLQVNLQ
jgi:hypothetical protein